VTTCSYSRCSHDEAQARVGKRCPGFDRRLPVGDEQECDRKHSARPEPRRCGLGRVGLSPTDRVERFHPVCRRRSDPNCRPSRSRAGEVPQIPASRSRGPSVLRTRAIRPWARAFIHRESCEQVNRPRAFRWSVSNNHCLRSEGDASRKRGISPRQDLRAGSEPAAGPDCAREGERSQPNREAAYANGMAAVWGDSFHGMGQQKPSTTPIAPSTSARSLG
jgi:hypothetical protein